METISWSSSTGWSQATFAQFPTPASAPGRSLTPQIQEQLLEIHILLLLATPSSVLFLCVRPKGNSHCVCPGLADKPDNPVLVCSSPALLIKLCCHLSCCQLSFRSFISLILTCNLLCLLLLCCFLAAPGWGGGKTTENVETRILNGNQE